MVQINLLLVSSLKLFLEKIVYWSYKVKSKFLEYNKKYKSHWYLMFLLNLYSRLILKIYDSTSFQVQV
jgi:hypothetical protein